MSDAYESLLVDKFMASYCALLSNLKHMPYIDTHFIQIRTSGTGHRVVCRTSCLPTCRPHLLPTPYTLVQRLLVASPWHLLEATYFQPLSNQVLMASGYSATPGGGDARGGDGVWPAVAVAPLATLQCLLPRSAEMPPSLAAVGASGCDFQAFRRRMLRSGVGWVVLLLYDKHNLELWL